VAKNAEQEAALIAGTIQKYVMKKGYSYSDFAIVTGDIQGENEIWKQIMEMYKIPYFLDYSEPMAHNPVVEIVGLLLEIFRRDFSYESVFALLKTGFFDIDKQHIYALENYVLQYGVRGYHWWSKAFLGSTKGLGELNKTRAEFMEIMKPLTEVLGKKSALGKEYISTIYDFMSTNKMAEKLYKKSLELESEGQLREAKAYGQVYEKFIAVLDKTMDILGEEQVERDSFMEVLQTGIGDMHLGIIPSTLDQVVIGDMERTRLHHVKILFVAGMNDGVIPKNQSSKGILVDKDRQKLKEMNVSLAPSSKDEMFLQQFYFYMQVTQPSEKLILSYREEDGVGTAIRPSYFIDRIQSLFSYDLRVEATSLQEQMLPGTEVSLTADFAQMLAGETREDSGILQVMKTTNPEMFHRLLQGYFYQNNDSVLEAAIARKLYGNHMIHSVSRLETYSGCEYQFFLRYGLKLEKRQEYGIESNHIGTILHAVMENFFTWVRDEAVDISALPKEARDEKVEQLTRKAATEENDTIFDSSFRYRHQLDVFIRIAKRSVENLCRHLEVGDMKPVYFEQPFSPENQLSYIDMSLANGVRMELSGVVDRVDIKETEDAVYVKVIDYKSGAKDIDYIKMFEGRQLQLTVYMNVMLELLARQYPNKKIIPTGMYYYHVYDPIIEEFDEEKLEKKRVESSRLTGLVNEDETSRNLMDGKTGLVTPVRYKKDGDLDSRNAALVTEKQLQAISYFVREKMIDIGNEMVEGNILMNPEKGELSSPCNLCDYKSVCRFEPGLGGNAYQVAPQMSKKDAGEEIFKKSEELKKNLNEPEKQEEKLTEDHLEEKEGEQA
jgi:ATP-dependent helicase/nuclease subunit B